jgi:hypothetical protein
MLVQTIVLSRPSQHPLQIAAVHGSDVVLGPRGYPIIDDGCESAVGLVSESAAELIIIIVATIIIIIIIIVAIIIIITIIIIIITIIIVIFIIIITVAVAVVVVAAAPIPSFPDACRMYRAAVVSHVTRGIGL